MKDKDLEKMFKKHKEVDSLLIGLKDSKKHSIKVEGTPVDVLYLFTELVRSLNGKIPTTLLKVAFHLGLEDEEND